MANINQITVDNNTYDIEDATARAGLDNKLPLSGGTMTGNIAMGGNKVTGLPTPTDASDAVNKEYVDANENYSLIKTITLEEDANSVDLLAKSEGVTLIGSFLIVGALIFGTTDNTAYAPLRRDGGAMYFSYGGTRYSPTASDVSNKVKRYWYRWVRPLGNYKGAAVLSHAPLNKGDPWGDGSIPPIAQGLSGTTVTDIITYSNQPAINPYFNDNLTVNLSTPNYFQAGTQFFIYGRRQND